MNAATPPEKREDREIEEKDFEVYFCLNRLAEVEFQRRLDDPDDGSKYISPEDILVGEWEDISLTLSFDDEDKVQFHLYGYHLQNEETKQFYHTGIRMTLEAEDIKRLHGFLGYLLTVGVVK